ncbi:MAG TPA: class I SAM-dependent methyltransferase [Tepidisphaeraceae bacterium]|nr:class I SAM-dependent methyltransferase [Tepidisphaeraceae bacterium]
MQQNYDSEFFAFASDTSSKSAYSMVPLAIEQLCPTSVLDIGCGAGAWLKVFVDKGISDYLGVDGDYVDKSALHIPYERFVAADLSLPLDLGRRFDMAVCLEVAEHIPERAADTLIASISRHADAVLFSAAIPHQGGTNHVNEQWPSYWSEKFRRRGYRCFDSIRWTVWNDPNVAWWFKQNTLIYLNNAALARLGDNSKLSRFETAEAPGIVHPTVYLSALSAIPQIPAAAKIFGRAAQASLRYHARRALVALARSPATNSLAYDSEKERSPFGTEAEPCGVEDHMKS